MSASERYEAAKDSGYLTRLDRHEHDGEWLTYCRGNAQPYVVVTRTPRYAYLLIDPHPLQESISSALVGQIIEARHHAVARSTSTQARVRVVGECMRIESIRPEDVERLARVVVAHCPTQTPVPKPYQTNTEVPTNRPRCATKAPPTDPNRI